MSTRGAWGFYKNGQEKVVYNHSDSYPEYLGAEIIKTIEEWGSIEKLNSIFDNIYLINKENYEAKIKKEHIAAIKTLNIKGGVKKYADLEDWMDDMVNKIKEGFPLMYSDKNFLKNSLFCEHAYIINLDKNVLEYYIGFNSKNIKPELGGRYSYNPEYVKKSGAMSTSNTINISAEFYGVFLAKEYPLELIFSGQKSKEIIEEMDQVKSDDIPKMTKERRKILAAEKESKQIAKAVRKIKTSNNSKI